MRLNRIRIGCILLSLLFIISFSTSLADSYSWIKVSRVVDGDTFVLDDGRKIRLIGVDTPETVHPTKAVETFGKEASEFTKLNLEGQLVRLEFDWQQIDKYGRTLAYVYTEDACLFNAKLIALGYGHAYTKYPFAQDKMDLFRTLEKDAREHFRGLWKEENDKTDTTASINNPKPSKDSDSGKISTNSKKYWINSNSNVRHNSSCRWYGKTSSGYYTNENVGKACGICGG